MRLSSVVSRLCRFVSCVWTNQDELYEFKCDMRKSRGELAAQEKEVTAEVSNKKTTQRDKQKIRLQDGQDSN